MEYLCSRFPGRASSCSHSGKQHFISDQHSISDRLSPIDCLLLLSTHQFHNLDQDLSWSCFIMLMGQARLMVWANGELNGRSSPSPVPVTAHLWWGHVGPPVFGLGIFPISFLAFGSSFQSCIVLIWGHLQHPVRRVYSRIRFVRLFSPWVFELRGDLVPAIAVIFARPDQKYVLKIQCHQPSQNLILLYPKGLMKFHFRGGPPAFEDPLRSDLPDRHPLPARLTPAATWNLKSPVWNPEGSLCLPNASSPKSPQIQIIDVAAPAAAGDFREGQAGRWIVPHWANHLDAASCYSLASHGMDPSDSCSSSRVAVCVGHCLGAVALDAVGAQKLSIEHHLPSSNVQSDPLAHRRL